MAKREEEERDDERESLAVRSPRRRSDIKTWTYPPTFSEDFERIMDDFRNDMEGFFWKGPWTSTSKAMRPYTKEPAVDIIDKGRELVVRAEVPGVKKGDIQLHVTKDSIEISAETKRESEEEKKGYYHREMGYTRIYRDLTLPEEVISDKAEASLEHGVLEVRIPKKAPEPETKKRKVNIK